MTTKIRCSGRANLLIPGLQDSVPCYVTRELGVVECFVSRSRGAVPGQPMGLYRMHPEDRVRLHDSSWDRSGSSGTFRRARLVEAGAPQWLATVEVERLS